MKNMCNVTTVLPHNLLQTNPCIRHNFSTQVFTASMFAGVRTLAGRVRFFSNTELLFSYCLKSLQFVCLQEVHLVSKCARKRLWVATTLFVSAQNNTIFTFWSSVNRPLSAILQTGGIYRIFHELQHSLARFPHRHYDVTILMGW